MLLTREAKLENKPAFENHRVCKLRHEASEEAVENEQLTLASKLGARLRRRTQSLLESLA